METYTKTMAKLIRNDEILGFDEINFFEYHHHGGVATVGSVRE